MASSNLNPQTSEPQMTSTDTELPSSSKIYVPDKNFASWWPEPHNAIEEERKKFIPYKFMNKVNPGFVSKSIGDMRVHMCESSDTPQPFFGLNRTISVDNKGTVNFFVDRNILIQIFNDRTVRMVDRKYRVTGTFTRNDEFAMIHPTLRAVMRKEETFGMAHLNLENRYEHVFKISTGPKRDDHSIYFARDYMQKDMMYNINRVKVNNVRPIRMRSLYANISKELIIYDAGVTQSMVCEELHQNGVELVTTDGELTMFIRKFEIALNPNGSVKIFDIMPRFRYDKALRLFYTPSDLHLTLSGYECRVEANFSDNIGMMARAGCIVTVPDGCSYLTVNNHKVRYGVDGLIRLQEHKDWTVGGGQVQVPEGMGEEAVEEGEIEEGEIEEAKEEGELEEGEIEEAKEEGEI